MSDARRWFGVAAVGGGVAGSLGRVEKFVKVRDDDGLIEIAGCVLDGRSFLFHVCRIREESE